MTRRRCPVLARRNHIRTKIHATLDGKDPIGLQEKVLPWQPRTGGGSTDAADVSWVVPTAQFTAATWVPGTLSHSWQATAVGATGIAGKGMINAAKTLAMTAAGLITDPAQVHPRRPQGLLHTAWSEV